MNLISWLAAKVITPELDTVNAEEQFMSIYRFVSSLKSVEIPPALLEDEAALLEKFKDWCQRESLQNVLKTRFTEFLSMAITPGPKSMRAFTEGLDTETLIRFNSMPIDSIVEGYLDFLDIL